MAPDLVDPDRAQALYRRSGAGRWSVPEDAFREALARSAASRFKDDTPSRRDVSRYLDSLRIEDVALACGCARGDEDAWTHFVLEFRPVLYRVAETLVPGGPGREIADSLYADLFGLEERDGRRRSLFTYYHGRSSLATWLRSVVAQRVVDRSREARRVVPLPEDDGPVPSGSHGSTVTVDPDRARLVSALRGALGRAFAGLEPRARLRLALYYAQGLTLAEIGRNLGESEATVSRKLAAARKSVRADVERRLRHEAALSDDEVALALEYAVSDWGFDVERALPVPDS